MKKIVFLVFMLSTVNVYAACLGSSSYYNCYDTSSGNSYSVQRYGNTTNVNGYNSSTGSSWSQRSTTIGDTTYTHGNANGNYWTETQTPYSTYGTDSRGHYYSYSR